MRIGITYNARTTESAGTADDPTREFDDMKTVFDIMEVIQNAGYHTTVIEADERCYESLKRSLAGSETSAVGHIDLVFNIAEGIRGESRESHIPAMLEMLGIPYSGSGPLGLAITLDKQLTSELLAPYGLAPKGTLVSTAEDLDVLLVRSEFGDVEYPLIVKPNAQGSSVGISDDALVRDASALKNVATRGLMTLGALRIEEYLSGREFTVGLLGNPPDVLPIIEVRYDGLPAGMNPIDSFEAKWLLDDPVHGHDPLTCPVDIEPALEDRICVATKRAFALTRCRDLARIDVRLDTAGRPKVIDINALPGLIKDSAANSRFPRACYTRGMRYDDIILSILHTAMERYGMKHPGNGFAATRPSLGT